MRKIYTVIFLGVFVLISCSRDTTFLITETSVGKLNQNTPVEELETLFIGDSIVKDTSSSKLGGAAKVNIYEKGGKHLLSLTPSTDSIPVIENVRVFDDRFVSKGGIGLNSTFKDILKAYDIKKIVTTLNSVVIFPEESNLYFTIDKDQLPSSLRFSTDKIEAVQIPDEAKIKYLMVGWD